MNSLMKMYNEVVDKVKSISEQIHTIEQEIIDLRNGKDSDVPARIALLEEQLVKIDEYVLTIKGLQEIAKKNLESQNILTIEAPPGYRVNINRLRKWAAMIDPTSANDPYAQRVLAVAKCDECFLEQKREEFTAKLTELKARGDGGISDRINALEARACNLKEEIDTFAYSAKVSKLAKAVTEANESFWYEKVPTHYSNDTSVSGSFAPGAYAESFPFDAAHKEWFKNQFGKFYDPENGRVLIPAEISLDKEFVITISCAPTKDKSLDKGIQNLILNIINNSKAGLQTVYVIDGVRFNTSSVGTLRQLENTFAMGQIPRNQEQITAALEKIVSSFADIDEILGDCDSVKLYNSTIAEEDSKKIPLTTVVLYGWPNAYEGRNKELLTKMMTNYERYGLSFVTVSYKKEEKVEDEAQNALPEYATHNAIHIRMFPNDTTIRMPEEAPKKFVWYVLNEALPKEYAESLKEHTIVKEVIGSEYIKRYSLEEYPAYEKGKKSISLPFGVDAKDQAHEISFDNENFASYLMGASGSGKSTLLHTLITGIIRNYHPDDVELWLADFKMSEFAQYMNPLPPHVKYILLDESPELVYDLLDKLTEKMMERQIYFMKNRKRKKVEQVTDTHMPVIFVILDEFSIMSQAVAESPAYKLKLQNLLAKGRALGIKFIFASQDFSKGINGLTATAKDQIQSRIAMKNTVSEINDTLELSVNMKTDQVRNWMEAIPPHYALLKYRDGDQVHVKRVNVMYFAGKEDPYRSQRDFIKKLNETMRPVADFRPYDTDVYVDKEPVLVDGNSYDAFDENEFLSYVEKLKKVPTNDFAGDEMFAAFGNPRLMTRMKVAAISAETRENILLVARAAEQACAASILLSAMKAYKLQGGHVQIWAYGKNRLYKAYKDVFAECGFEIVEDIDAICDAIYAMKQNIVNKHTDNTLVVMIGMDRICMDFDYIMGGSPNALFKPVETVEEMQKGFVQKGAVVATEEDKKLHDVASKWSTYRMQYIRQLKRSGKAAEEIKELVAEEYKRFTAEVTGTAPAATEAGEKATTDNTAEQKETVESKETAEPKEEPKTEPVKTADKKEEKKEEHQSGAYNAAEDFATIVKLGSRLGYHFLLNLNSLADLKQTGLREEYFRYKMAFQVSADDSRVLFNNKCASELPAHICQMSDTLERYSFRPYLHKGISWEGWSVDENGNVMNPYLND